MKNKKSKLAFVSSLLIILVALATVSITVSASYIKHSNWLTNTFTPSASVQPKVMEEFNGNEKKNVYIQVGDTGYPVYVRAAIVITWQDKDGIVYYSKPNSDSDYTIDLNTADWELKDDGFYYYKSPVASGGDTSNLINSCIQKGTPIEGYTLNVEIIVQTIQAVGSTDGENDAPVVDAWKDAGWNVSQ